MEPFNFSFFSITGWGIDLDYIDIEWFALETNRDHFVVFETVSKYCILDSFVAHDGYSISPEGPTSNVRNGGGKEIPLIQGKEQQLCSTGAAVKRYPTPKVRETQVRW